MFVLRTNHTFVLRINLVVLRITTRGVLSVIFDSLQVSIDPRHARCPNLNPFDPGRFPYFPDGRGSVRKNRPTQNSLSRGKMERRGSSIALLGRAHMVRPRLARSASWLRV